MDSLIAASARALAAGDMLRALKLVALRDDAPALALRGIAMARLDELERARELLRCAARAFGVHEVVAQARCVVAEAEVALAMRDLAGLPPALEAAADILQAHGDEANAVHARLVHARRLLLMGRLAEAGAAMDRVEGRPPLASLEAVAALVAAELALRSLRTGSAQAALVRTRAAAARAGVPALTAEVAETAATLRRPAGRRLVAGGEEPLVLEQVEACLASGALVVDACRRRVGSTSRWLPLERRPLLFALAWELGRAGPQGAGRDRLIATVFRTRHPDETHRARLRVEIGRLRALMKPLAAIAATPDGFVLKPFEGRDVVLLAPPIDGEQASLVALLSDGAAWSTSALAMALGATQRTVQRALVELEAAGQVRAIGRARARRWLAPPLAAFTTILLLPASLPLA